MAYKNDTLTNEIALLENEIISLHENEIEQNNADIAKYDLIIKFMNEEKNKKIVDKVRNCKKMVNFVVKNSKKIDEDHWCFDASINGGNIMQVMCCSTCGGYKSVSTYTQMELLPNNIMCSCEVYYSSASKYIDKKINHFIDTLQYDVEVCFWEKYDPYCANNDEHDDDYDNFNNYHNNDDDDDYDEAYENWRYGDSGPDGKNGYDNYSDYYD